MNTFLRKWGEHILRSRQYASGVALFAAFLSFFGFPIGWLSTVVIALVTLQQGIRPGAIVAVWAILPAAAMLYLGQYTVFLDIFIYYALALSFAAIFRYYKSWVMLIQLSALLGVIGVLAIHYLVPDMAHWLVNQLELLAKEYKQYSATTLLSLHPENFANTLKYIELFATGLLVVAMTLTNLLTVFLARWWQSFLSPTFNLQRECYTIRLHYSSSLLLAVFLAGVALNNILYFNVLLVLLVPFVISGLSALHAIAAGRKYNLSWLLVFYLLFIFFSPYLTLLLAVIGWVDGFYNIRKKLLFDGTVGE